MRKKSTCSRYDRMTYSPKIVGLTKVARKEASKTITYVVILERKGEENWMLFIPLCLFYSPIG